MDFGTIQPLGLDLENQSACTGLSSEIFIKIDKDCRMDRYLTERRKSECGIEASKCELNVESSYIFQNCPIANFSKNMYVRYLCLDRFIELGSSKIDRTSLNYLIVYIDVAGIIVLLITIIIILKDTKKVKKIYKKKNKVINQFTIHIKDVSWNFKEFDWKMNNLAKHLEQIIENGIKDNEGKELQQIGLGEINDQYRETNRENDIELSDMSKSQKDSFIYEINYPYIGDKKLNLILEREKLISEFKEEKIALDQMIDLNDRKDELKIVIKTGKLEKKRKKIEKIISSLGDDEDIKNLRINDIFITFTHPRYRKYLYKTYDKTKCTRCCYIFCCKYKKIKHLYFEDKWININRNPDNPSNIKWENMLLTRTKKCFSKSISILLAFFLILIGFMFIVLGKYYQEVLNKEFNLQIDCNFVPIDNVNEVYQEYRANIPERNKLKIFCYCKNLADSKGYPFTYDYQFPVDKNIFPCQKFVNSVLAYNSLTYLIMFMIPLINSVITVSLTLLTSLEKNNNLTQDKSSNMIKIFIGQFINTGLLLLIVNTRIDVIKQWSNDFPIFTGAYGDFSPAWFLNIGCTIFFTMIISIVTIHLGPVILAGIKFLFRCLDSGNQIGVGSKKNVTTAFMKLYVGPELPIDARYAQVFLYFLF